MQLADVIRADRLRLERWKDDHLDQLMVALERSIDDLRVWMAWAQVMPTRQDERVVIAAGAQRFEAGEDFEYFLMEDSTDELVGAAGLHRRSDVRGEIGYWVRSDRHRQGYATEAAAALTAAAFERGFDIIEIRMDKANVASAGVPAKLGYACTGEDPARERVAAGHTGRGWIWTVTRDGWQQPDTR